MPAVGALQKVAAMLDLVQQLCMTDARRATERRPSRVSGHLQQSVVRLLETVPLPPHSNISDSPSSSMESESAELQCASLDRGQIANRHARVDPVECALCDKEFTPQMQPTSDAEATAALARDSGGVTDARQRNARR